jgi:SAM-dependent methyltransferase
MNGKLLRRGKVIKRTKCRLCDSQDLYLFLNLGYMPHAGDFLTKKEVGKELLYPLKIYYCKKCGLVQILDIIPPSILFKNYHYLSSVSLSKHFGEYALEMNKRFLNNNSFVVEIGSNDGVLLSPLSKMGIKVLGVDPARNVAQIAKEKGIETIVDFFNEKTANKIVNKHGQADAIFANNVLAHMDNMDEVFAGIKILLKPDGVLIFEVHYLPDLIKGLQYDFFYNEHLSYYSLTAFIPFLKRYGLEIFEVKQTTIHSGSVRIYTKFKENNKYKTKKIVGKMLTKEKEILVFKKLKEFAAEVVGHKNTFVSTINTIKNNGNKIAGYGASGRANTLLNYCGIDYRTLDYIVDESPERQGKFTPGTHIPVVGPEFFRKDNVKFAILLAWNYQKEIVKKEKLFIKRGGKFIIPLPAIKIINR